MSCTNQSLQTEIEKLINRASRENESDTPDFILAKYLMDCLLAFERATAAREQWYGRDDSCVDLGSVVCGDDVDPTKTTFVPLVNRFSTDASDPQVVS